MQAGKISFNLWVKSPLFVQQTGMHFVKTFLNKNQGMLMHFPGPYWLNNYPSGAGMQ